MKLLFDQNLSPRLVIALIDLFPGSVHVSTVGLSQALDADIWRYARDFGFTVVTRDSDFCDLAVVYGVPPKVIWLRLGNVATSEYLHILQQRAKTIKDFAGSHSERILILC